MTISYFILFLSVIGIFLFCYFIATRVWIKVDKKHIGQLAGKKIDILINNAGITRDNIAVRMKDEEWQEVKGKLKYLEI